MKLLLLLLSLASIELQAQSNRKLTAYITGGYSETIYDHAAIYNPRALGLGIQAIGNTKGKLKPIAALSADAFISTYKVYITDLNGEPLEDVPAAYSLFVGGAYTVSKKVFVAATCGPSFINGKRYFGVKPSIGFYPGKAKKTITTLSFTNIFNREPVTKQDFGFATVTLGIKLF